MADGPFVPRPPGVTVGYAVSTDMRFFEACSGRLNARKETQCMNIGSPLGGAAPGDGLKRVGPRSAIIKTRQEGRYVTRFVRSA